MPKLTIEELIQQKLNKLEVSHKPEYWSKMEEKLDSSIPAVGIGGVGSGLSKIYLISGIATSVVVIFIIGYFGFKNHSFENIDKSSNVAVISNSINIDSKETATTNTDTKKIISNNEEQKQDISSTKTINNNNNNNITKNNHLSRKDRISSLPIASHKQSMHKKQIAISQNNTNKNVKPIDETTIQNRKDETLKVFVADMICFDKSTKLSTYNPKDLVKRKYGRKASHNKEINVSNELIVIKPIQKPAKRVFKKGILYKLGIRR